MAFLLLLENKWVYSLDGTLWKVSRMNRFWMHECEGVCGFSFGMVDLIKSFGAETNATL